MPFDLYSSSAKHLFGDGSSTTGSFSFVSSSTHCAGVSGTRKSGGILPSFIIPIFMMTVSAGRFWTVV
jgi:hypothetical protein